jgi:hypothetical protein
VIPTYRFQRRRIRPFNQPGQAGAVIFGQHERRPERVFTFQHLETQNSHILALPASHQDATGLNSSTGESEKSGGHGLPDLFEHCG